MNGYQSVFVFSNDQQLNGIQVFWNTPTGPLAGLVHGGKVGDETWVLVPTGQRLIGLSGIFGPYETGGFFSLRQLTFTLSGGMTVTAGKVPPVESYPFAFSIFDDGQSAIFGFFGSASYGTPTLNAIGVRIWTP